MSSIERLQRVEKMTLIDQAKYSSIFSELASLKPIHKRVSNVEIELLLQSEFRDRDLDLDFDYRFHSKFSQYQFYLHCLRSNVICNLHHMDLLYHPTK